MRLVLAALAAAVALPMAVIVLVLAATPGGAGASAAAPAAAVIPAAGIPAGGTGAAWAQSLLAAGGWPQTRCNVNAIVAWERAEGSNPAWHNLLDTTLPGPGSSPVNSVGVQAYPTVQAGLAATVATLRGGPYGPILAALAARNNAQAVAAAVAASPWGTEPFTASCA